MKKFLKAVGRVLLYALYVIVVLILIGILRWLFKTFIMHE